MYEGFKKDWFWSFVSEGGTRVGALALFISYYPYLGASASGEILASYAYAITAWLLIDLGLGLYGTKEIASAESGKELLQIEVTIARGLMALLWGGVFVAGGVIFLKTPIGILAGFLVYLGCRALAVDWRLRGEAKFRANAVIALVASSIQICTALIFVRKENWQITASLPWAMYAFVLFLGSWWMTCRFRRRPKQQLSINNALRHIKTSIGYSLSNGISVFFQQSPVLILSTIYGASAIAGFAIVHRVSLSSVVLFQVVGTATFPQLVKLGKTSKADAWILTRRAMILIALMSIGILVVAGGIVAIPMIQRIYLADTGPIVLIAFGVFLVARSVRVASARYLLATDNQNQYAKISFSMTIGFLLVSAILLKLNYLTINSMALVFAFTEVLFLKTTTSMARKHLLEG